MDWFSILKAARRAAVDGQITSEALAKAMKAPTKVASAWLGKFIRWGYVLRDGSVQDGARGRPKVHYRLTKYGLLRKAPKKRVEEHSEPLKLVANPKKKKEEEGG